MPSDMTPTPEARELEAEAELRRHMAGEYASDAEDKAVASFRTAVRDALVAEMVESIVDERATDHLQMDYKIRLIKRITEAHPTETEK